MKLTEKQAKKNAAKFPAHEKAALEKTIFELQNNGTRAQLATEITDLKTSLEAEKAAHAITKSQLALLASKAS